MTNKAKKYLLMSFVSILLLIAAYSGGVLGQAPTKTDGDTTRQTTTLT